jgi:hypothetical protein
MVTLYDAVEHFLRREPGIGGTLTSDGIRLLSYGVVIAYWDGNTVVLPRDQPLLTRTTRRHKGMIRRTATTRNIPITDR